MVSTDEDSACKIQSYTLFNISYITRSKNTYVFQYVQDNFNKIYNFTYKQRNRKQNRLVLFARLSGE